MTRHEVKVTFTSELVDRSLVRFIWMHTGIVFWVIAIPFSAYFVYSLIRGESDRPLELAGMFFIVVIGCIFIFFFTTRSAARKQIEFVGSRDVTFVFSDELFSMRSPLVYQESSWRSMWEIRRYPKFWHCTLLGGKPLTLPTATLSSEVQQFIVEKVKAAGGRVH